MYTVGNVPLQWYKDEDHIGYDVEVRAGLAWLFLAENASAIGLFHVW